MSYINKYGWECVLFYDNSNYGNIITYFHFMQPTILKCAKIIIIIIILYTRM